MAVHAMPAVPASDGFISGSNALRSGFSARYVRLCDSVCIIVSERLGFNLLLMYYDLVLCVF